jgi:tetratricopeptide (TPR) repeat protein
MLGFVTTPSSHPYTLGVRPRHLLLPAVVALTVAGCTSTTQNLFFLSEAQWGAALRQRGVDPEVVPDPVAFTPRMREEAEKLAGRGDPLDRLHRLQQALFDEEKFPFTYEFRVTLTAAEAFQRREGNCLSFTNLFVAMSRSLDIPVTTALVTWVHGSEREDDLIVVNTHVVAAYSQAGKVSYYDFDRTRREQPLALKILNDLWITALYVNNRGADALRLRLPQAAAHQFETAVRLAPRFAPAWGNLGVALRRMGDISGALHAYQRALEIDPTNPTVLSNLATVYRSMGRDEEADAALAAANISVASPHTLLVRGDLELAQGHPREARRLFSRARHLDPQLPEAWVALARAELALHQPSRARRYLLRALKLDGSNKAAHALLRQLGPTP